MILNWRTGGIDRLASLSVGLANKQVRPSNWRTGGIDRLASLPVELAGEGSGLARMAAQSVELANWQVRLSNWRTGKGGKWTGRDGSGQPQC
jgi:hypothetical protein